ncbi:hypothetical protein, partial [Maricaulis maris]|uniref:hypothetical protein n=1 Tax=Maricaulis maris TaxID=74318 RepID=UPI003A8F3DA2
MSTDALFPTRYAIFHRLDHVLPKRVVIDRIFLALCENGRQFPVVFLNVLYEVGEVYAERNASIFARETVVVSRESPLLGVLRIAAGVDAQLPERLQDAPQVFSIYGQQLGQCLLEVVHVPIVNRVRNVMPGGAACLFLIFRNDVRIISTFQELPTKIESFEDAVQLLIHDFSCLIGNAKIVFPRGLDLATYGTDSCDGCKYSGDPDRTCEPSTQSSKPLSHALSASFPFWKGDCPIAQNDNGGDGKGYNKSGAGLPLSGGPVSVLVHDGSRRQGRCLG